MSFCPHSFIIKNFKNSFIKTILSSFMADEKTSSNQAYVLLNVDYKHQKNIINKAESLSTVQNVKTMYGIYDLMIILESDDMGAIKKTIDEDIHDLDGIINMTSLVTVGTKGIHSILE